MQISNLKIEHYRSLELLNIKIDPLTTIVGTNNAGKSTILSAIELFFDPAPRIKALDHFFSEISTPISITVEFDKLTSSEREEFGSAVIDDKLQVTRELRYQSPDSSNYSVTALTNPEFSSIREEANGTKKLGLYREIASKYDNQLLAVRSVADVDANLQKWETEHASELKPQKIRGFFGATNVANGKLLKRTSVRLVPAVKEVSDEVRDNKKSPIIGLLGDIAKQTFENRQELKDTVNRASAEILQILDPAKVPQLANISDALSEKLNTYYQNCRIEADWAAQDPININYPIPRIRVESNGIVTPIENVGHGLQRAVLFSIIEFLAGQSVNQKDVEVSEFDSAASDIIMLIEEPEIYQHPSKQFIISRAFHRLTESFNRATGIRVQAIFTTHSEKFVNLSSFSKIRVIRKISAGESKSTQCWAGQLGEISCELANLFNPPREPMGEVQFAAKLHIFGRELSEGFFADKVVLVEGVGDKSAIEAAFTACGRDALKEGISIIQVDGKTKIDKPWLIFRKFAIPAYIVFDNDLHEKKRRTKTKADII